MPKVTLINVTSDAMEMLILAKSTRLEMTPDLLTVIHHMSQEEKLKEVEYIANTIPASWEFVDFIFLIQDVTRAFTHQFVRGRHASYAQQTMRVLNVEGFEVAAGPTIDNRAVSVMGHGINFTAKDIYEEHCEETRQRYKQLIDAGCAIEDARGILPTNILTNILVKMNLRTFVETVRKRSSSRVQGEYREVLNMMKQEILKELPWVEKFVERTFDKAAAELDYLIGNDKVLSKDQKMAMIKLLDQMRMQS